MASRLSTVGRGVGVGVDVSVKVGMEVKVGVSVSGVEVSGVRRVVGGTNVGVTGTGETVEVETKLQAVEIKNSIPISLGIVLIQNFLLPFHELDSFDVGHWEQG